MMTTIKHIFVVVGGIKIAGLKPCLLLEAAKPAAHAISSEAQSKRSPKARLQAPPKIQVFERLQLGFRV